MKLYGFSLLSFLSNYITIGWFQAEIMAEKKYLAKFWWSLTLNFDLWPLLKQYAGIDMYIQIYSYAAVVQ